MLLFIVLELLLPRREAAHKLAPVQVEMLYSFVAEGVEEGILINKSVHQLNRIILHLLHIQLHHLLQVVVLG